MQRREPSVISSLRQLEGRTVKSVNTDAANIAYLTVEDGTIFEVEAEPIGYGIYAPSVRIVSEIPKG
jgi:hypothetical protein